MAFSRERSTGSDLQLLLSHVVRSCSLVDDIGAAHARLRAQSTGPWISPEQLENEDKSTQLTATPLVPPYCRYPADDDSALMRKCEQLLDRAQQQLALHEHFRSHGGTSRDAGCAGGRDALLTLAATMIRVRSGSLTLEAALQAEPQDLDVEDPV